MRAFSEPERRNRVVGVRIGMESIMGGAGFGLADVLVTFCVSNLGGRRPPVEQGDSEGLAPT